MSAKHTPGRGRYSIPQGYSVEPMMDGTWSAFMPDGTSGGYFWTSPLHKTKADACQAARTNWSLTKMRARAAFGKMNARAAIAKATGEA